MRIWILILINWGSDWVLDKICFILLVFISGCGNKNIEIQNDYHPNHDDYPELEMIKGYERPFDGPPEKK